MKTSAPETAFDYAVHAYQHTRFTKKLGLLERKKGILELRSKGASFDTIASILSNNGFPVSADTVTRFCNGLTRRKQETKKATNAARTPSSPLLEVPPKPPVPPEPGSRGPRIANSKNV